MSRLRVTYGDSCESYIIFFFSLELQWPVISNNNLKMTSFWYGISGLERGHFKIWGLYSKLYFDCEGTELDQTEQISITSAHALKIIFQFQLYYSDCLESLILLSFTTGLIHIVPLVKLKSVWFIILIHNHVKNLTSYDEFISLSFNSLFPSGYSHFTFSQIQSGPLCMWVNICVILHKK